MSLGAICYVELSEGFFGLTRTTHAARELARKPNDTRRTRSQFESALCVKDPLFAEKCYLIVESDPQTYEYASYDPRWKNSMKEEFSSLQKNNTWELIYLPPREEASEV